MLRPGRGGAAAPCARAALAARGGDVDEHGLLQGVDGPAHRAGGAGRQAAPVLHGRAERRRRDADGGGRAAARRLRGLLREADRLRRDSFRRDLCLLRHADGGKAGMIYNILAVGDVVGACGVKHLSRCLRSLMDYISSFMLSTLCMIGGTMTVLLKEWMIDHQRVSQMEKVHVLSEVEQLKEQVSPELLFKTLHHSGELTLSEPEKASKMLMKLSQLLRYQLYDCSRTKVLLSSEINFLNNYLTLEQNSQAQFNYELLADGEVNRTLVPPLLFIPFVQYIVKSINEQRTSIPVSLKIHLKVEENTIIFTCLCLQVNLLEDKGLERIRQRLNLLYGNRYRLFLTTESIWLELKGGEV